MFQYNTLSSDDGEIRLSVLYCPQDTNKFIMPSITFFIDDVSVANWDSGKFIFGEFYDFVLRWINQDLRVEDKLNFAEVWDFFEHGEFAEEILEMIETAIAQGWYPKAVQ